MLNSDLQWVFILWDPCGGPSSRKGKINRHKKIAKTWLQHPPASASPGLHNEVMRCDTTTTAIHTCKKPAWSVINATLSKPSSINYHLLCITLPYKPKDNFHSLYLLLQHTGFKYFLCCCYPDLPLVFLFYPSEDCIQGLQRASAGRKITAGTKKAGFWSFDNNKTFWVL